MNECLFAMKALYNVSQFYSAIIYTYIHNKQANN